MYVIVIYDVASERTTKLHKACKKYLTWVQNSVFEGELSDLQLRCLRDDCWAVMDESYDSLIIFRTRTEKWLEREVYGVERGDIGQFL